MKTICIKTNNIQAQSYLLENLKKLNLEDVYFSCHKFKVYTNIIIHYKGTDSDLFYYKISHLLSYLILDIYEKNIFKNILNREYFYFDKIEQNQILNISSEITRENMQTILTNVNILQNIFNEFLQNNKKLYLKGFITFRLKKYIEELEKLIDSSVSRYIIEREYTEFVSLLKAYINSETSKIDVVHLIYQNEEPILLDQNKNIIKSDINLLNAKYLSDISFSSSDMVLNTLLNLIPKKIYVHLINNDTDDFIATLKLIFEKRIHICTDCNICNIYRSKIQSKLKKW